ncbi:hypothetical protein CGC21_22290 [Leishmania donovani]|uniref:Uncharacterized protein n=1 Tax=Leishmania donovani TaxID=5661 RepID=A0A3Q8IEV7_LEIDO|nr:hypothetical protein LdCL_280021700 [Leishmania donovani]TPP54299.1 hypothetical protein CGC21_22290 [Leishmania donovani]
MAQLIGAGSTGSIPGIVSIQGWSKTSTEKQQAWIGGLVAAIVALVIVYGLVAVQLGHKPRYVNAAWPHLQNIGSYAELEATHASYEVSVASCSGNLSDPAAAV